MPSRSLFRISTFCLFVCLFVCFFNFYLLHLFTCLRWTMSECSPPHKAQVQEVKVENLLPWRLMMFSHIVVCNLKLWFKLFCLLLPWCLVSQKNIYFAFLYFFAAAEFWNQQARDTLDNALKLQRLNVNIAKNIILFLGDGMDISTSTAARIRKGQLTGKTGEEASLQWDGFQHVALSKVRIPYCLNLYDLEIAAPSVRFRRCHHCQVEVKIVQGIV